MEHWDAPSEAALARWRAELPRSNGIAGLTVIDAADGSADWAQRAAALIHRDGFACVANVVAPERLERVRAEAEGMVADVLAHDELDGVNGHRRYSLGGCSATGACLHHPGWASLVGVSVVDEILTAVWGSGAYTCYGADANFASPGSGYQALHSDFSARSKRELDGATGRITAILAPDAPEAPDRTYESSGPGFHDPSGKVSVRQLPCPDVCVNIPLGGFTPLNGPPRLIAGSHHWTAPIPSLADEPQWMQLSTPCPLPIGSAVFRDPRTWHAGTPNVSSEVRIMLAHLYSAPWWHAPRRPLTPPQVFEDLSARGQELCHGVVGGDAYGPEGQQGGSADGGGGVRWGDLRPGLSVLVDHGMTGEAVQWARSHLGSSQSQFYPPGRRRHKL